MQLKMTRRPKLAGWFRDSLARTSVVLGGVIVAMAGGLAAQDFDFGIQTDKAAYAPGDASLASGPGAQISHDADRTAKTAEEIELGRRVAAALSLKLVEKLLDLGVDAQRFDGQYPPFDNIVIVEGQFTSIDRGSRMARVVIGFGYGKSDVRTHAQVYQKTLSKRRLLQEFTTSATSSYTPGLVVGLGVGAAAGTLATSVAVTGGSNVANESFGADVAAGAERTATELAAKMKPFFIDQAWIPAYDG